MPANKYALLRYRIIDRKIGNKYNPYPSIGDLRDACEEALYGSVGDAISISTIEKDLKAMREETELGYFAPIKYSKREKGYFYEDENYSINDIPLNDDDLEAIKFAATTLFQFKGISLFNQFESAIDKIFNRLNITTNVQDTTLNDFVQFDAEVNFKGKQYLQTLLEVIRNQQAIELTYQSFTKDTPSKYEFHPYLLKEYKNRWYLIGYRPEKDMIITYALDRIKKVEAIEKYFDLVKQFNKKNYFKYCFGITHMNEEPSKVVIQFNALQGKYIKAQKLHPTQKVLEETQDHLIIEITVVPTYELYEQLLSYGPNAKVLEPLSLKEKVKQGLIDALKGYE